MYGIEKDYRLVKVGKVGCYLHGDGLARVLHSDGLGNFANTKEYTGKLSITDKDLPQENRQFDVLVSNPPYSVAAFRNNAGKYYGEDDFELYQKLTDQSSEIECLFVERAKQLLKDGGVAGIILPSSILSNSGIYTKTREILLRYFEIIAITELGSNTFMATGTNTVTMFLRRRNNYDAVNIEKSVERFTANLKDITINGIETPVAKYVAHTWEGLVFSDYLTLLQKTPNEAMQNHEIYGEYCKKIKAKDDSEQLDKMIALEKEKLLYFILAYPQKVVLIKSGEKKAEKAFLGYEFSNRRGSEGIHPIQRGCSIDECTKLYDAIEFENPEKSSTYIYQAFNGNFENKIHESLEQNIRRVDLVDLLTFDRVDFEKSISLATKKKVEIESKWDSVKLDSICEFNYGINLPESRRKKGAYPILGSNGRVGFHNTYHIDGPAIIVGRKGSVGEVVWEDENCTPIDTTFYIALLNSDIELKYLFWILKALKLNELKGGAGVPGLNRNDAYQCKIPLPPKEIQKKIVAEISILEEQENKAREYMVSLNASINTVVDEVFLGSSPMEQLGNLTEIKNGGTPNSNKPEYWAGDKNWATIVDVKKRKHLWGTKRQISGKGIKNSSAVVLPINTILFSSRATIGEVCIAKVETATNQGFKNFICDKNKLNYEYLYYILLHEAKKIEELASGITYNEISKTQISKYKVPLPTLQEQQKIVSKIEKIERQVSALEAEIQAIPQQKEAVLKKYL